MQESSFFARVDRVCFAFLKLLVGLSFCLMIFSVFLSIVMREFGFEGFPWLEEASQYLVVWSVFLSAAVLARRNEHISIDIFYSQSSARTRKIINVLSALLGIGLIGYLAYMGWGFSYTAYIFNDVSLSGYLPVWVAYVSIPVGLGLTALAYVLWLVDVLRNKSEYPSSAIEQGQIK